MNLNSALRFALASLCAASLALPASAQTPRPTDLELLGARSLRAGTTQTLDVPQRADREASFTVTLGDRRVSLDLAPADVRSDDFRLLVQTETGVTEAQPAAATTLRGHVVGVDDSKVAVNVVAGGVEAVIVFPEQVWWITPTGSGDHLVFRDDDMLDASGARCGVKDGGRGHDHDGDHLHDPNGGATIYQAAEMWIDCDKSYHNLQGGGLPQVTQAAATNQMNLINAVYEGQLGLTHKINGVYVQAVFNQYPSGALGTFTDMNALLVELQNFWNTHPTFAPLPRDVVHHLSGKGTWVGTVGIAYIGVICNRPSAYGVSRTVNANPAFNNTLIAHELGHNWNANHCDGIGGCGIMNSIISTPTLAFGPTSLGAITGFASSLTCLENGAYAANASFGRGCAGSSGLVPAVATNLAKVGEDFVFGVSQCPADAPVSFILGYSNTQWSGTPLPLDLAFFGMPNCSLRVAINLQFPATADGTGTATTTMPIPNQSSLVGFCFYTQVLVIDRNANPRGIIMSDAAAGVVGNL